MELMQQYSQAQQEFLAAQHELNRLRMTQHNLISRQATKDQIDAIVAKIKSQHTVVNETKAKFDAIEQKIAEANIAETKRLQAKTQAETAKSAPKESHG